MMPTASMPIATPASVLIKEVATALYVETSTLRIFATTPARAGRAEEKN
jgi:hypothetical protein